jgi:hypothetical protein
MCVCMCVYMYVCMYVCMCVLSSILRKTYVVHRAFQKESAVLRENVLSLPLFGVELLRR